MSRWHEEDCRHPDVNVIKDCAPFCQSCGAIAPGTAVESREVPSLPPQPPATDSRNLNLSWPPSVKYTDFLEPDSVGCQNKTRLPNANGDRKPAALARPNQTTHQKLSLDDEIRLLRLSQGCFADPLHGTIENMCLKSRADYDALSYTWADETGDSTRRSLIYLGPWWDVFHVTSNCELALRRLRYEDQDRVIWVDSVCINQDDDEERSHQVDLMRNIYSNAMRVAVYLGESFDGSDLAMGLFSRNNTRRWSEGLKPREVDWVRSVFRRSYFSRLWVVQELALAKSVDLYCGSSSVVSNPYGGNPLKRAGEVDNVPRWVRRCQSNGQLDPDDLFSLLLETTSCQCADPRDKVFALLGLIQSDCGNDITSNYALSVEQVYIGIAAHTLQHHGLTKLLVLMEQVYTGATSSTRLPTWVPDWSKDLPFDTKPQTDIYGLVKKHEGGLYEKIGYYFPKSPHSRYHRSAGWLRKGININRQTGFLHLEGSRICQLSGQLTTSVMFGHHVIVMERHITSMMNPEDHERIEARVFISAPTKYKPVCGEDFLYYVADQDLPVILRKSNGPQTYSFICMAKLLIGVYNSDARIWSSKICLLGEPSEMPYGSRHWPELMLDQNPSHFGDGWPSKEKWLKIGCKEEIIIA